MASIYNPGTVNAKIVLLCKLLENVIVYCSGHQDYDIYTIILDQ
jgi:hypothetical protein